VAKRRNEVKAVVPAGAFSALANIEGLFDASLTAGAKGASGGIAPFISTEDGVLRDGANEIGNELDVVILGVVVEHALYPGRFVKGQRSSPVCFSIGTDEEAAAPHPTSPQAQADTCASCIKNAFGSAGGGSNAKACRQSRRLLVMPLGERDSIESAPLRRLRVPPTSIKNIAAYVGKVEAVRPLQTVVTRITVSPHEKYRFEVTFTPLRPISDREDLEAIARRVGEGKDALFALPMLDSDKKGGKLFGGAGKPGGEQRRRVVKR
jgi:hypothetical protein